MTVPPDVTYRRAEEEQSRTLSVRVTDKAGNTATGAPSTTVLDTTVAAPSAPACVRNIS